MATWGLWQELHPAWHLRPGQQPCLDFSLSYTTPHQPGAQASQAFCHLCAHPRPSSLHPHPEGPTHHRLAVALVSPICPLFLTCQPLSPPSGSAFLGPNVLMVSLIFLRSPDQAGSDLVTCAWFGKVQPGLCSVLALHHIPAHLLRTAQVS